MILMPSTWMTAVRQARVPDIPRRTSFIKFVSTTVALRVALKWLKSDSGASLRHTIPTIMLRTANVPMESSASQLFSSGWGNLSLSLWVIPADKSLRLTWDHLVNSAHEEIRDEGKERGVKTVDGWEVGQEGECHAWKERRQFGSCHINHDDI